MWLSDYNEKSLINVEESDTIGLLIETFRKANDGSNFRNFYLGYNINLSKDIHVAEDPATYNYTSDKKKNEYNRNKKAELNKDEAGKVVQIYYERNKCLKIFGTQGFLKSPEIKPAWQEFFMLSIPKTGNLFLLDNRFPEKKSQDNKDKVRYGQFIVVMGFHTMLDRYNYYCLTKPIPLDDPFQTDKNDKPKIKGKKSFQLKMKDGKALTPLMFRKNSSNMKIAITGQLYGKKDKKEADRTDSQINLSVSELVKNYKFNVNNKHYEEWNAEPEKEKLDYAYMDGSLTFETSGSDQVVIQKDDYSLVFTKDGALKLKENGVDIIDLAEEVSKELKEEEELRDSYLSLTSSYLSLINGDFFFFNDDDNNKHLVTEVKLSNWVNDRYARLTLNEKGELSIISLATEVDDNNEKPGIHGLLYRWNWAD